MARSLSFGQNGEAEWRRLEVSMQMEERGACTLLVSDNPECLAEALRRLSSLAPSVIAVVPDETVVLRITDIEQSPGVSKPPIPAAWLQADVEDDKDLDHAWRKALCALNQRRDHLRSNGPVFVILAGPRKLRDILAGRAPDLLSILTPALVDLGDEATMLVELKKPLCWLHLSDLHIEKSWQQDVVLNGLIRDLPKQIEQAACKPNLVFVTGDIAKHGTTPEYDIARGFFEKLMVNLGLDPKRHLFIVPGNHDVDETLIIPMVRRAQDSIRAEQGGKLRHEVGEILGSPKELTAYSERLAAYGDFTTKLLGPGRGISPDRVWRTDVFEHGQLKVGIASLCSAWMCRPQEDEYGKVVLGERQAREALDELSDAHLRIILLHHPLTWLHLEEQAAIIGLLRKRARLVLHGHLHQPTAEKRQTSKNECIFLEAGAVYTGSSWPHGFQLAAFDPEAERLTCHFFTWSKNDGGFWCVDPSVSEDAPQGKAVFTFALEGVVDHGAGPVGLDGLAARIKKAATKVLGTGRGFIGIPAEVSASGSKGSLMDLFVPLDFDPREPRGFEDEKKKIPLAEIEARLYAPNSENRPAPRYVVLGGPGSGKSTLVQYLAVAAASREKGPVPIRMVLREYLRQGAIQSLLAFAAKEISDLLAVTTGESDLKTLCNAGRALLLVDGLDEVSNSDERERIRQMIAGLADRYPLSPILSTSRLTGYDQAPLDKRMFYHVLLSPFDDAQLATFISHWYDTAEPDNARERDRKKADLEAALVAEPRAKELARNPLFATLIALVHRYEAHLPGERAKLYELCVRMLLETWPRRNGRQFQYLDEGRQRAVLERLALSIQKERGLRKNELQDGQIAVSRDVLERRLAQFLGERESKEAGRAEKERIARLYVDWLKAGTGILVEQQPGVFGFIHLSIMEYLAGQALLDDLFKDGVAKVAGFVLGNFGDSSWRETILLMLGSRGTERHLVDSVMGKFLRVMKSHPNSDTHFEKWLFLLQLMREEADLTNAHKTAIMDGIQLAAATVTWLWDEPREAISVMVRFSKRHSEWLIERLTANLSTEKGDRLFGAVVLTPASIGPEQILALREDLDEYLPLLLDLWPQEKVGQFAAARVGRPGALSWAEATALDMITPKAFAVLHKKWTIGAAALSALFAKRCIALAKVAKTAAHRQKDSLPGLDIPGIPAALEWTEDEATWVTFYCPTLFPHADNHPLSVASFAQMKNFSRGYIAREEAAFIYSFIRDPGVGLTKKIARRFTPYIGFPITDNYGKDWIEGLRGARVSCALPLAEAMRLLPVDCPWKGLDTELRSTVETQVIDKDYVEMHAGHLLGHAAGLDEVKRNAVSACRQQNYWLHLFFEPMVKKLGSTATIPEHYALLLAMGLASYQTLWMWPWGDEWKRLAEGAVPDHYLPAHFWHLCAAARDSEHQDAHLAKAEACLNRSDWPELAEMLRDHVVRPTPKEILDLFQVP